MAKHKELKLPTRFGKKAPGAAPGVYPDQVGKVSPARPAAPVKVTVIDYSADQVEMHGVRYALNPGDEMFIPRAAPYRISACSR